MWLIYCKIGYANMAYTIPHTDALGTLMLTKWLYYQTSVYRRDTLPTSIYRHQIARHGKHLCIGETLYRQASEYRGDTLPTSICVSERYSPTFYVCQLREIFLGKYFSEPYISGTWFHFEFSYHIVILCWFSEIKVSINSALCSLYLRVRVPPTSYSTTSASRPPGAHTEE